MTASFADNEIWHVLVESDDMKRMNVEQLDDAFRLSLVDASTLVWKAGMKTWQRLGAVAGLDDDPDDSITRRVPPPPPPPRAAPPPRNTAAASAAHNPFLSGPNPFASTATNPFAVTATNPFAVTAPQSFPMTAAPVLKAPVFTPALRSPDPYALPKRRAAVSSEVDFRRGSRGFRFGRWLTFALLLSVGVLALYRQNLLREGARRIGLENKYLYGERRVTAYVDAKAPAAVKSVLGRLALLPGPNAATAAALTVPASSQPAVAAPVVPAAPAMAAVKPVDTDVKTIALDSLPVLSPDAAAAPAAAATEPAPLAMAEAEPIAQASPAQPVRKEMSAKAQKPARAAMRAVAAQPEPKKAEPKKAEPKKAEPKKAESKKAESKKAESKPAPAPANEGFLKAAIRSAIAADGKK